MLLTTQKLATLVHTVDSAIPTILSDKTLIAAGGPATAQKLDILSKTIKQ